MKPEKTVLDVQTELENALRRLPSLVSQLPDPLKPLAKLAPSGGVDVHVSLRRAASDRQVKRSAPADTWSTESGLVSISYGKSSSYDQLSQEEPTSSARAQTEGRKLDQERGTAEFAPIDIRGERLSETILRGRR